MVVATRRRQQAAVWAASLALALGLSACARHRGEANPNFNGNWQLDAAHSQGMPAMMQGHSTIIRLAAARQTFTITFIFDGNPMNVSNFTLDGKDHPLPLGNATGQATAECSADGRTIHLEIRRPARSGGAPVEKITFALQPDNRTIRRVRTVPGGNAAPQVYIYQRLTAS